MKRTPAHYDTQGAWQPDDAKTVRTARKVVLCIAIALWIIIGAIGAAVWG